MGTAVLRDLKAGTTLADALVRNAFALAADGWTFLDGNKTWALSGWAGGSLVTGTEAALTRLQMSSLHYFQRPDIDYARVDPAATSLSGWAGRLYLNKQQGNVVFDAALGAMSPGFEANDLGYHTRGDVINGHVELGYQTFHPGPVFRRWYVAAMYYRNYDFGGIRSDEYIYLDGEGQFSQLLDGGPAPGLPAAQAQPLADARGAAGLLSVGLHHPGRPFERRP